VTPTGKTRTDRVVRRDWRDDDRAVGAVDRVKADESGVQKYLAQVENVVSPHPAGDGYGIFHPNFMQSRATTRRFSSAGYLGDEGQMGRGNTQNFTRGSEVRSWVTVPPGYGLWKLDLSSIEPRLGAHAIAQFLGNDRLQSMYCNEEGFNLYVHVLRVCANQADAGKDHPQYNAFKHGVLARMYGGGVKKFAQTLRDKFELPYTEDDVRDIYAALDANFPELSTIQRHMMGIVDSQGYLLDDFGAKYYVSSTEEYKAMNTYCQGCAGNILKFWWNEVDALMRASQHDDYIFNAVHDELDVAIVRSRDQRKRVKVYTGTLGQLSTMFTVPILADYEGPKKNWRECG